MAALNARKVQRTTADELAFAFDRSFALARAEASTPAGDFLAIKLGGVPYALQLGEIAGLHALVATTQLPSPMIELRGLTGLRGTILPIYDLAALIGLPLARTVRWFVVAHQAPVAFAVETFEGHFRVPVDAVVGSETTAADPVRSLVRSEGVARPLIQLPSVITAIRERCRTGHSSRNA